MREGSGDYTNALWESLCRWVYTDTPLFENQVWGQIGPDVPLAHRDMTGWEPSPVPDNLRLLVEEGK